MQRCLQLAQNGLGRTYPNPMVGCVIVHNQQIIGEGWHTQAGEGHAEVQAINSVRNKALLAQSTLYVNLEPCNHFGKTPPCTELIIQNKIKRIVIGTIDFFSEVSGRGIARLQQAGCEVIVGVLQSECREMNRRFFTFHQQKRPYIILKWAQSLDGYIAPITKEQKTPFWITNPISRQLVHKWRSEEQAILVGKNTILEDNPQLTTRHWFGKNPLRVVIDPTGEISEDYAVYDHKAKSIIFSEKNNHSSKQHKIDFEKSPIASILNVLYMQGIQSVIVEGGSYTLQQFIAENLWDETRLLIGKKWLNNGIKAPKLDIRPYHTEKIANDDLFFIRNHNP